MLPIALDIFLYGVGVVRWSLLFQAVGGRERAHLTAGLQVQTQPVTAQETAPEGVSHPGRVSDLLWRERWESGTPCHPTLTVAPFSPLVMTSSFTWSSICLAGQAGVLLPAVQIRTHCRKPRARLPPRSQVFMRVPRDLLRRIEEIRECPVQRIHPSILRIAVGSLGEITR